MHLAITLGLKNAQLTYLIWNKVLKCTLFLYQCKQVDIALIIAISNKWEARLSSAININSELGLEK